MPASHFEFHVEEVSMEAFLSAWLPRFLPQHCTFGIYPYSGKDVLWFDRQRGEYAPDAPRPSCRPEPAPGISVDGLHLVTGNLYTVSIYKTEPGMIDFARIVGFQWDQGNSRKSTDKHGVSQVEAEQVFQDQQILVDDDVEHSRSEHRFHALGVTASGRRLHVTFTLRAEGTLIRIISARDMHRQERAFHGRKT